MGLLRGGVAGIKIENVGAPSRPIRVLVAKVGLDGHDRGVKIVARALRDAGMEVIYTGLHRTPREVVEVALQEDVDAIGVSILSGAHMTVFPKLLEHLREHGLAEEIAVRGGGVIPDEDAAELQRMGVAEIVGQEATPEEVVQAVRRAAASRATR
jgi:methylmalonyl-CoA mutase cobalamin-binding domain/chain